MSFGLQKPKYGQKFINERGEVVTFIGFGDREQEDWIYRNDKGHEGISTHVLKRKLLDEFIFTGDESKDQEFVDSLPITQLIKKLKDEDFFDK